MIGFHADVTKLMKNNIGEISCNKFSMCSYSRSLSKGFKFKYGSTMTDINNRKTVFELVSKFAHINPIDNNGNYKSSQALISEWYASCEDSVSEMLNSLNETNIKDVYGMNLGKGVEGNIEWEINGNGRFLEIKVSKEDLVKIENYECDFEPIFGYDCVDVSMINKKLDDLINSLKDTE